MLMISNIHMYVVIPMDQSELQKEYFVKDKISLDSIPCRIMYFEQIYIIFEQIISKSCILLAETDFTPLILVPTLRFP